MLRSGWGVAGPMRSAVTVGAVLAAVALAVACGRHGRPAADPGHPIGTSPEPKRDAGPRTLQASLVATLAEKAVGPVLAMHEDRGLAAYLATAGSARTLVAVPLDGAGAPTGDARVVANVSVDSSSLVLARAGDRQGWIAAWAALTEKGEAVYAVGIALDGRPRGVAIELGRSTDDVVWLDLVPTRKGTVCVWAEETRRGDANLLAAALDATGRPRGVASYAARGAVGWQVAPAPAGAALALLRAPALKGEPSLDWVRLDEDAHPIGDAVRALTGHGLGRDLDVVANADGGFVAAWTDRSRTEAHVVVASLDDAGRAAVPRDLSPTSGASVLTAIAAGPDGVLVGWEDPRRRRKTSRQVHLDVVARGGSVTRGAVLEVDDGAQPELRAAPAGFAVLARARLYLPSAGAGPATQGAFGPALVLLDNHGAVARAEPVVLPSEAPALTWNLSCASKCVALAATAGSPTRVFVAPLARHPSAFRVAAMPPPPADAPDVLALATLSSGALVSDVATARVPGAAGFFLASLTANDDGTGAVGVRTLGADGAAGPIVALAKHALTVGGIAIASGPKTGDGTAVAWVAREHGDPQVRVARLDTAGKRTREVQLTAAKGDASDVAIGWTDGGFMVAWVDARDGNGEVYAARLDANLTKGREERLTSAPGDATDLTMLVAGERAWLAWADPRESPKDGFADIWTASIGVRDAKRDGEETRVLPSVAHSRSPSLSPSDGGAVVAWIEEAPAGADPRATRSYGAMLATLDARGKVQGEALRLPAGGDGFPTGVWLDREATGRVRGVLVRGDGDDLQLDAFEVGAKAAVAWPVMMLDGPASLDVPLAFAASALVFGDDGPDAADRRLRHALLGWKR